MITTSYLSTGCPSLFTLSWSFVSMFHFVLSWSLVCVPQHCLWNANWCATSLAWASRDFLLTVAYCVRRRRRRRDFPLEYTFFWGIIFCGLPSALTYTVSCGTLYMQVLAIHNPVQSIELITGGLQLSCRNISSSISGNKMHFSSLIGVISKGVHTCVHIIFLVYHIE